MIHNPRANKLSIITNSNTTGRAKSEPSQCREKAVFESLLHAIRLGKLMLVRQPNGFRLALACSPPQEEFKPSTVFKPRMDVYDRPKNSSISLIFELPGVKRDDLHINAQDGSLVVHGERRPPTMPHDESHHLDSFASDKSNAVEDEDDSTRMDIESDSEEVLPTKPTQELRYGKFYRSTPLPDGITFSHISATMENGILVVTYPRRPPHDSGDYVVHPSSDLSSLSIGNHRVSTHPIAAH